MQVMFQSRRRLAPDTWEYVFLPERPLLYVPGQYVELRLGAISDDARGSSRVFTLTSLPSEPVLRFAIDVPTPRSPYKHALTTLHLGDQAHIGDAIGDVILPKYTGTPLVFVAGGLGIASYVGMLQELIATGEARHVDLRYAYRHSADMIFTDLLNTFPFASRKDFCTPERLQVTAIVDVLTPESLVYLSGSERFVEGLRAGLQTRGVAHERIVFDFFEGYKGI